MSNARHIEGLGISEDELSYQHPEGKYNFRFEHLEQGIFRLHSEGFIDSTGIRAQMKVGEKIRAFLRETYPGMKYHLVWDISKVTGGSILARRIMFTGLRVHDNFESISVIGSNRLVRGFGKLLSNYFRRIKFSFHSSEAEALEFINFHEQEESLGKARKINFYSSEIADYNTRFMDAWQKTPGYTRLGEKTYKSVSLPGWKYQNSKGTFFAEYKVVDGNIVFLKATGKFEKEDVHGTYRMLEDIMQVMGYDHNRNRFYSIIDLKDIKSISLGARKSTLEYEEKYSKRAHLVILIPSSILRFVLRIQQRLSPMPIMHWVISENPGSSMDLVIKHREGLLKREFLENKQNLTTEAIEIPRTKLQMASQIRARENEIKQFKQEQEKHLERLIEITGRMTWDDSLNQVIQYDFDSRNPFSDLYNSLAIVQEDFMEIIRQKNEQARMLQESEDKYRNLVNLANDLIVVVLKEKIRFINPSVINILGYEEEELIDQPFHVLFPGRGYNLFMDYCIRFLSGNDIPPVYESVMMHKKGYEVFVSMSMGNIEYEGMQAVLLIARDVTQKKRAEQELANYRDHLEELVRERTSQLEQEITERKEAEESDRLKTAFLSNMSHEIRTPMNAIVAFAKFLGEPGLPEKKRAEYLGYIQSSSMSLLNIINDVIDIAKIETRQLTISLSDCHVVNLLNELFTYFNELKIKREQQNIALVLDLPGDEDTVIQTDPFRLRQILSNLLDNALKFTDEGYIRFGFKPQGAELEFYVEDSGIGIPEDKMDLIFKRFGKVEYSSNRNIGGTGLGLAISQNLVRMLGGDIRVISSACAGTTFTFTIPDQRVQPVAPQENEEITVENMPDWSDKCILIAEDEELNFKVLEISLSRTRVRILRAADGQEAVDWFSGEEKIDLVLMDIQMPRMDGYMALGQIKLKNPRVPVIAQTAYAMQDEKDRCIKIGFDDYLSKPIDLVELLRKVAFFFDHPASIHENLS